MPAAPRPASFGQTLKLSAVRSLQALHAGRRAYRLVPPSVASRSLAEVRPERHPEGSQLPPHPAALSLITSTAIGTRDTQSFISIYSVGFSYV